MGKCQTPVGPREGGAFPLSPLPASRPEPPGPRGFFLSSEHCSGHHVPAREGSEQAALLA